MKLWDHVYSTTNYYFYINTYLILIEIILGRYTWILLVVTAWEAHGGREEKESDSFNFTHSYAVCIFTTRLCHTWNLMPKRWHFYLPWAETSQLLTFPMAASSELVTMAQRPRSNIVGLLPGHSCHSHYVPDVLRASHPLAVWSCSQPPRHQCMPPAACPHEEGSRLQELRIWR